MTDFDTLTWAFDRWFETPLNELPDALRQRAEREFAAMPWDSLSADQRRLVALQLDYQHDPATEQDRQFWWDFFERQRALKKQIQEWECVATPTAGDLATKESRLLELRQELTGMERQELLARGDYYPARPQADGNNVVSSDRYMAYPLAMNSLAARLDATPEELAAWVWLGPKDGGLAAYLNANELDLPPRFHFDVGNDLDYLAPLMACWFIEDDLARFGPADRYITGKALIERWSAQPGIRVEAFIRAKIAESRLLDAHPTFGCTQGTFPEELTFPPLADGLFVLSHVEAIEAEDFALDVGPEPPQGMPQQSVTAEEIIQHFAVNKNPDANAQWWRDKMRDAKRNGLVTCRVGAGKKGPGGSLWRPDAVAIWLSTDNAKGDHWMNRQRARACLKTCPGFEQDAEDILPSDD